LASFFIFSHTANALTSKFDGEWDFTIYSACDKSENKISITIKAPRVNSSEKVLDLVGGISDNGKIDIVAVYNGKTFYTKGIIMQKTGSGEWVSDNCSGTWKAEKK